MKQEEAKLEAARRKILETTKHDPTLNQLADVVGVPKSSLDKILCGGRESRERITGSYKRLVVSIASNYQGRGLNMKDLVQVPIYFALLVVPCSLLVNSDALPFFINARKEALGFCVG